MDLTAEEEEAFLEDPGLVEDGSAAADSECVEEDKEASEEEPKTANTGWTEDEEAASDSDL